MARFREKPLEKKQVKVKGREREKKRQMEGYVERAPVLRG